MKRTIIKDANILTPQGFQRGNLIIENEKILEVASPLIFNKAKNQINLMVEL